MDNEDSRTTSPRIAELGGDDAFFAEPEASFAEPFESAAPGGFAAAALALALALELAAFGLNPRTFLLVSRTRLGWPRYRSSALNPTLEPSLAPYTPAAIAVTPATSAAPLFSSARRALNPEPTAPTASFSVSRRWTGTFR